MPSNVRAPAQGASFAFDMRGNGNGKTVNTLTGDHNSRASDYTTCVVESADFLGNQSAAAVAFAQNQRSEVRNLHDCAGALAATPGMKQQTFIAQKNAVYSVEGNGSRPSHRGDGFSNDDVSYTLNSVERHAVCYQGLVGALCANDHKFPQQQQVEQGKAIVERVMVENRYIVRRLTPTECALLQGFPPDWCAGLETPEPTEEDIAFWSDVWEAHRKIIGKSSKPKSRKQVAKWLQNPYSDAVAYKMWGNGVALPCVVFVLSGIVNTEEV
jgi:DNA (cytosine-5)-methyltransferase 1